MTLDPIPARWWADSDFWKSVFRVMAVGVALAGTLIGGAVGVEEVAGGNLTATEALAGATKAAGREAQYEAWRSHREDIEAAMIARAKCDSALESFARHRDDPEDWAHVLDECHTEGGVN